MCATVKPFGCWWLACRGRGDHPRLRKSPDRPRSRGQTGALKRRDVDEYVLVAALGSDEAETLGVIEEFYSAIDGHGGYLSQVQFGYIATQRQPSLRRRNLRISGKFRPSRMAFSRLYRCL